MKRNAVGKVVKPTPVHRSVQSSQLTTERLILWAAVGEYCAGVRKQEIQDTKTYLKCYVGRNGKRNQQNYTYKCVDRSRHNGIKGAKAKCAH